MVYVRTYVLYIQIAFLFFSLKLYLGIESLQENKYFLCFVRGEEGTLSCLSAMNIFNANEHLSVVRSFEPLSKCRDYAFMTESFSVFNLLNI